MFETALYASSFIVIVIVSFVPDVDNPSIVAAAPAARVAVNWSHFVATLFKFVISVNATSPPVMLTNEGVATTKVSVSTNATLTCATVPCIFIAFDTVAVAAVLPPIADNAVAAIVCGSAASNAASFNVIVIKSVAPVSKSAKLATLAAAIVAVTTPHSSTIKLISAKLGLSDISGFDDVAVIFVASVTNAAFTSAVVPLITIAFVAVTVPDVLPDILVKTVAFISTSSASLIVKVNASVEAVDNVSKFAAVSVLLAVTTPVVLLDALFICVIVGAPLIVTADVAATTNEAVVTNAASISDGEPVITNLFDSGTVTTPPDLLPIPDNTVAANDEFNVSLIVIVISSLFVVDKFDKTADVPIKSPLIVPEPAIINSLSLLKSVMFAAVTPSIWSTVISKFGSAVRVVVKFALAVAAPAFIISANASLTPAADKSIVVADVFPTNVATSSTFIEPEDTVIVSGSFPSVVNDANCVLLPDIVAVTVPDVDAFTVFNAVTFVPTNVSVTVNVNAPEDAAKSSKFANVLVIVPVTVPEPAFTNSTNLL